MHGATHVKIISCTLFVFHPHLFLRLEAAEVCLLPLLTTQNRNIHAPGEIYFCFFFVLSPGCPGVLPFALYCTKHNTNNRAPGGCDKNNGYFT
jgi:hypothetical protein